MDNNNNNNETMFNTELGLGRIATAATPPEIRLDVARRIKIEHHVLCLVAFVSRTLCALFAAFFLISSQICVEIDGTFDCIGSNNVELLGAEAAGLLTRMSTISWFESTSMSVGCITLLGSLICVPEEKLTRRTLQLISAEMITMNLVFGSIMLVTLFELEKLPDVVEVYELSYVLVGICLALTPFLYYCPSEAYRELVRHGY